MILTLHEELRYLRQNKLPNCQEDMQSQTFWTDFWTESYEFRAISFVNAPQPGLFQEIM